jgi:RNA polymerase subunit RPABC4/transcription elongation factor Spt4
MPTITVECESCVMRDTEACRDCVVTFLVDREPDDAIVIDADEARAMRMLEQAGLLPSLRFQERAG